LTNPPSITPDSVTFTIASLEFSKACDYSEPTITLELTAAETADFPVGSYTFTIEAVIDGLEHPGLVRGCLIVQSDPAVDPSIMCVSTGEVTDVSAVITERLRNRNLTENGENSAYVQGAQVWWDISIRDEGGQPVDPATLMFYLRKPCLPTGQFVTLIGTYTGGEGSGDVIVTRRAQGEYSALGVFDAAGEYRRRVEVSGGVIGVKQSVFLVTASVI
jgi:hypothetical protein